MSEGEILIMLMMIRKKGCSQREMSIEVIMEKARSSSKHSMKMLNKTDKKSQYQRTWKKKIRGKKDEKTHRH